MNSKNKKGISINNRLASLHIVVETNEIVFDYVGEETIRIDSDHAREIAAFLLKAAKEIEK